MTEAKKILEISPERWETLLNAVYQQVSRDSRCAPALKEIGRIRFQLSFSDRPDLAFWEEYLEDRVRPHLGVADDWTVQAKTSFPVFVGTLLREISIMEAAADESWELFGDTEALLRCANILPYVMLAFSEAVDSTTDALGVTA